MLQLSTIKLCKSARACNDKDIISKACLWRMTILIWVIPNQHFINTLLGWGHKKSTLCTLVKMMTILDDPYDRPSVDFTTFATFGDRPTL